MAEKLTWDEIQRPYPDDSVALVDHEWPDSCDPKAGVVYAHGRHRRGMLERSRDLRSAAILYSGKPRSASVLGGRYWLELDPGEGAGGSPRGAAAAIGAPRKGP